MDYGIKAEAGGYGIQGPAGAPLPLPKLVFLIGGAVDAPAFAAELGKTNPDILIQDYEEPLRNSTHLLFWTGFSPSRNLMDPATRAEKAPKFDISIDEFLHSYKDFIEARLGEDALGKLVMSQLFDEDGDLDVYSSYVFTDANTKLATPFIERFGPKQCLFLYFGITSTPSRHNHPLTPIASHLAMPDVLVSDQITYLRNTLTGLGG